MIYTQLVAGFIYLLGGGDLLVRGAVAVARRFQVPETIVALTIVGLGTSLPELVVSVRAALEGHPGIALGNVVGSNIANVLLVGGLAATFRPLRPGDRNVARSGAAMLLVSLLFVGMCLQGKGLTRVDGALLLVLLFAGLMVQLHDTLRAKHLGAAPAIDWVLGFPSQLPVIVLFIAVGLVMLPLGAALLVDAAVDIAGRLGVSETLIGLTIVAVGTSLPELATTVLAARKRRTGLVVGTIVGSNNFNILAIMGAAAIASGVPVAIPQRFLLLDLPVMVGVSLVLVSFSWRRRPIRRQTGMVLVGAYALYMGVLALVG
ncbi:MAG: calcium/sodium antiporter [Gemmatimonadetes bacterium]|nr:calcium/sodium antiporter [Gemmatimonadota bacterium]